MAMGMVYDPFQFVMCNVEIPDVLNYKIIDHIEEKLPFSVAEKVNSYRSRYVAAEQLYQYRSKH